jgi:NAD(P)-dependent dehydrogenase (short-subunit alcohol dehydrogenase family)
MEVTDSINRGPGSARFYGADFASFDQVRALGQSIRQDYDRLDVIVNNAGFGSAPDERLVSEDGHEFRFQVNYLSPFLLTDMLLPLIRASAPSRIVNVSSLAQRPIDWDDVMIEEGSAAAVPTARASSPRWATPSIYTRSWKGPECS